MSGGLQPVLQAAVSNGLSLDPFSFGQDGWPAPEVDVGRGEIVDALVVAAVVVVVDEGRDLGFEIAGQEVIFQQDAVFESLVPALDLALGHWMIGRAAQVLDLAVVEPLGEIARDVAGPVVWQEPRPLRGLGAGSSGASWMMRWRTSAGMRFQTRSGRGERSVSASGAPPLYRSYQR